MYSRKFKLAMERVEKRITRAKINKKTLTDEFLIIQEQKKLIESLSSRLSAGYGRSIEEVVEMHKIVDKAQKEWNKASKA